MGKYFFQDFKEQIEEESEKFEAHNEKTELSTDKCKHKKVSIKDGILFCPCGARWEGAGVQKAYDFFTRGTIN